MGHSHFGRLLVFVTFLKPPGRALVLNSVTVELESLDSSVLQRDHERWPFDVWGKKCYKTLLFLMKIPTQMYHFLIYNFVQTNQLFPSSFQVFKNFWSFFDLRETSCENFPSFQGALPMTFIIYSALALSL